MPDDAWIAVDRYLDDLFVPRDSVLEAALEASKEAGLPDIQISPSQGKFLHLLARLHGARKVLELGTLGGYSTIWLARALPPGGRLVTLELEPAHAEVARQNLKRAGLGETVDVRVGPALATLPQLAAEEQGPFDLVFIDADKENYPEYLDWALRLSQPGTLIIADNIVQQGAVVDAADDRPKIEAVRRFNEKLAAHPRLTAAAIQVVGCKGHDGFAAALVEH